MTDDEVCGDAGAGPEDRRLWAAEEEMPYWPNKAVQLLVVQLLAGIDVSGWRHGLLEEIYAEDVERRN